MHAGDIRYLIPQGGCSDFAEQAGVSVSRLRQKLSDESISVRDFKGLLATAGQDEAQWLRSPLQVVALLGPMPWEASHRPGIIRSLVTAAARVTGAAKVTVAAKVTGAAKVTVAASAEAVLEAPITPAASPVLEIEVGRSTAAEIRQLATDPKLALRATYDLDKFRLRDPVQAAALARVLVTHVAPRLPHARAQVFARGTGVLASCLRNTGELKIAGAALRLGLIVAQRAALPMTIARLSRRAASLLRDRFQYDKALRCLDAAAAEYLAKGDLYRLTKTLVTRGIVLSDAARYEEAENVLNYALRALPDRDIAYKAAVHIHLSVCAMAADLFGDAEQCLDQAEALLAAGGDLSRAPIVLQRGHLALAANQAVRAVEMYQKVREMVRANPISQAAVTIELISALGQAGRLEEVRLEANRILFALEPFSDNPPVAVVLAQVSEVLNEGISRNSIRKLSGAALLLRAARI